MKKSRATVNNFTHKHFMRWRTRACNLAMHIGGHSAKSDHKQTTQLDSRCALAGIARVFAVCQQRLMCGQRGCRRLPNRLVTPVSQSSKICRVPRQNNCFDPDANGEELQGRSTRHGRSCQLVKEWRTMHCALVHGMSCLPADLIACLFEQKE